MLKSLALLVIPVETGIHFIDIALDFRLCGNDILISAT